MSILESAENLAKTLSTAANIKATDLEQGITGPVETSDVYTMQKEQELENDRQALESPVESSTDWYAKLKKTNLVPQQKSYYFDNTKQIVDGLGIPGISDYDINLYLDNNDLEGLDNLLLDKYKNYQENSRRDSYRNVLEAFDMTAAQKIDAIKQLKQKEPDTPLDLKDIIKVRSQITGEVLKNREKNLSSQTSARNDVLEDTAYKTNRIAQLAQKNLKAREERSYLEAFGDFTERSLPGVRFHQTAMQNLLLESLGARNEKGSFLDNLIKSTFTGSSWQEVADNIWELPKPQFDAVMDLIENNPLFARNLFAQGEVLGALLGTSELTTGVTNVLDAVNVLGTARLTKTAFQKGAVKPEVIPPEKGLKGPVIIDADFTVISEEPVRAEASRALTMPQFKNALIRLEVPQTGRFRQVVGYKYLKDGDFVVQYRYFNNVKDIFEAFKENPNAVIQSVPETDKFPAGKIREVNAYDSIYAKGYQTIDPKTFNVEGFSAEREAIKAKIKGTKVVDSKGEPLVLYHGTSTGTFDKFDNTLQKYGLYGEGVYATDAKDIAWGYTKKGKGKDPAVYSLYMDIKKPLDMESIADPQLARSIFSSLYPNSSFTDIEVIELLDEPGSSFKTIEEVIKAKNLKNKDLFSILENEMMANETLEYDAGEYVRDALQKAGYDGITHIGGVRGGKKHRVYIALDESQVHIINKEAKKEIEEAYKNASKQASARAYAEGSTIEGDLNAGARNTASEKLKKKINDFEKGTGEQPTEEDIFVAEPEILSGAPRNTTANAKILQEPKFTIPTNDQIRNVGPYMNIADLDLNAANKLTEQATNVFDKTMAYLRSQPIDLKVAKTNTQTELGGIITNEVYGIGSQGNSPLDLTFLEAQELTAGGPFRVIQDTNGDIWLSRDNYISYDSGIATPIDYANVEGVNKGFVGDIAQNTRMWSIGASGVPNEIADQTYQAVGYRAGWKDILTKMVQRIEKGVSKKERALAESIFQEEALRGERFTEEELVAKAGTLTNVVNYVKNIRMFEDLGKSAVNNFERQAIIAEGYKGLTFNKNPFNSEVNTIANDFSGTLIAKKVDKPVLSDLQKDFVAYTQNGSVIPPQTKLPFELDKVDVYRLQHSLYNNKWDKINYVVTPKGDPNAVITKVPEVVIGDQPHAGWGYKDKWFIRFDRTAKDSAGRVQGYTKTAATAKTYKEAVAYVDKFKRIGQVINNYNEGLIGEAEANRAIQKIAIEGKYPFVPELQTLQGFLDYLDTRRMTDITNVSKLEIGRDVFSPDTAIQLDDGETIASNNLASRWKVGKSPLLNPGYSNRLPKRTDLSKYLGDLVNRNASLIGMMPTYQVFARRFAATFGKLVDRTVTGYSDISFLRDPDRFIRATAQTSKEPLYNQAKTFSRMVNMAMDQANQEPRWNAWVNQQVDKLVKSEFPGYSSLGEVLNNEHNPVKLLTGFLYSTTFALRPAQIVTQTALTTIMSLGLNPVKTMKAVGALIPVLHAMNVIRRGINVESSLEALVKWPAIVERWPGFTTEDLKALALEARNLGYGELSFNDVRNNGVMTKAGNWIHKVVYYPFEEGNQWSRLIGLIVSAERRSSAIKKPIAQFTKQDWAVVAKESDALSGGSSRANKRWAIEEIPGMKQFSMMQSFVLNTWESFFGRKLDMTKLQKLRWAGVMLTLFGLDMFLESKDSETTALSTQDTTGIDYKLAAHGLLGWGLATLFGYEVDVGSNAPRIFGNLYADIVNMLADTDDVDTRPYIAATIGRVVNSAKDIYLWLQNPEEYGVKDEHHLTTAQKLTNVGMSLARIWTGLSEAEKLWAATQLNEWRNRAGLDIIPFDEKREDLGYKAFVQYMTGFRPIEETGVRRTALQEAIKKKKEDTATGVTLSKKYWLNYCKALANERIDPKTLAEYEANAFHITALTVQGLTIAEQNETLDAVYKFYNELDKATRDYIAKKNNPWVQDSEAFKQAVEEYKYRIEGTTKPNTEKKETTPSEIGRVRDGRMQLIE